MDTAEVTQLLRRWRSGSDDAFDQMLPLVYQELRHIAVGYMKRERSSHTLGPTDLVHEAYLRLAAAESLDTKDRSHFFAVAARAMRRILVDHARSQQREKRVGAHQKVELEEQIVAGLGDGSPAEVIAVHDALEDLAASHPRQAKLVELRFFGGFSEAEAAEILDVSRATITRDWRFAKVWLRRLISKQDDESSDDGR